MITVEPGEPGFEEGDGPSFRNVLRVLFGALIGGAAAFLVLMISRSGAWGRLMMQSTDSGSARQPEEEPDEPTLVSEQAPEEDRGAQETSWCRAYGVTHKGLLRAENQDRYILEPLKIADTLLALVADGMGGHSGGAVASQIAVQTIGGIVAKLETGDKQEYQKMLVTGFTRADEAIRHRASKENKLAGMGTTGVGTLLTPGYAVHAYTGDSRLYQFRADEEIYCTRDHSVVRYLLDEGIVDEESARNHPMRSRLTASLGGTPPEKKVLVEPRWDSGNSILELKSGDVLVLCSDGLNSEVEGTEIRRIVSSHASDPKSCASHLLNAALEAGGRDNVTIIVVNVL